MNFKGQRAAWAALAALLIPACGGDDGTTRVTVPSTVTIASLDASPATVSPGGAQKVRQRLCYTLLKER